MNLQLESHPIVRGKRLGMTLGSRIKKYRAIRGWTQDELADALGVSQQTVHKWERDDASPRPKRLLAIAEAFHVTPEELLFDDSNTYPRTDSKESNISLFVKENFHVSYGETTAEDALIIFHKLIQQFEEMRDRVQNTRDDVTAVVAIDFADLAYEHGIVLESDRERHYGAEGSGRVSDVYWYGEARISIKLPQYDPLIKSRKTPSGKLAAYRVMVQPEQADKGTKARAQFTVLPILVRNKIHYLIIPQTFFPKVFTAAEKNHHRTVQIPLRFNVDGDNVTIRSRHDVINLNPFLDNFELITKSVK